MTFTQENRLAGGTSAILKLQLRLYGLKQASKPADLRTICSTLKRLAISYTRRKTDLCLYYKHQDNSLAIDGIYVDDLLTTAGSTHMVDEFSRA
jgi:hypothetical protein